MVVFYRVVTRQAWQRAQRSGYLLPSAEERQAGWVQVNCPEDLSLVARRDCRPEQQPLALELDLAGQEGRLRWLDPSPARPWQQPVLKVARLELAWVRSVHPLMAEARGARYRLGSAEPV